MSKSILITDEHINVKNGDIKVYENQKKGFLQMIDYALENDINHIYSLGDFFDTRVNLNNLIIYNILNDFFDLLKKHNIKITMLVGNHSMYVSDSLEVTNLEFLDKAYDNVEIIKANTTHNFNDKKLLLVPWLLKGEKIPKDTTADMILGHLEINSFNVSKTYQFESEHGLNPKDIKIPVLSGHFHSKQTKDNITYLGNSFIQTTWSDFGEEKGFHVLNEDLSTDFIRCNTTMHINVFLDSEDKTMKYDNGIKEEDYKINTKTDYSIFSNHKLKIFIDKDNAFNKKIIEKILENNVVAYKVVVQENIQEQEESSEETKEYSLEQEITNKLDTDYQKKIFDKINLLATEQEEE